MIPQPHRRYVLELLSALGQAADSFVLVGAQAMKFTLNQARATRDFDFVLDVIALRKLDIALADLLGSLGYVADAKARNFQFEKRIPGSAEVMRIEFMAPEQYKREGDIRVDVKNGIHARACTGGAIVVAESDYYELTGVLPDDIPATVRVRVARPTALLMMKCLALDDRYRNLRGAKHYEHDREEAAIHAADIVAIVSAQTELEDFRGAFMKQFDGDPTLGQKTVQTIRDYYGDMNMPGLLLYEEYLRRHAGLGATNLEEVRAELRRAQRAVAWLIHA